jgi:hypothetical protein
MEERRQNTIDHLLTELGHVKQIGSDNSRILGELNVKVGIQNGRVGKLERWQAFMQGGMALMVLLVLPIALYLAKQLLASHWK